MKLHPFFFVIAAMTATSIGVASAACLESCASAPVPSPKALSYSVEVAACTDGDAAAAVKNKCVDDVDAKYGRDGGAK